MFCKKCGKQIPAEGRFCPFCGEKVGIEAGSFGGLPGNAGGAPEAFSSTPQRNTPSERGTSLRISDSFSSRSADGRNRNPNGGTAQAASNRDIETPRGTYSAEPPEPKRCPKCGAEIKPDGKFCGVCGTVIQMPSSLVKRPIGKKQLRVAAASIAALCVVVGMILGIVALATRGPHKTLFTALDNTLNASSFTAELVVIDDGYYDETYHIEAALDLKDKDVTAVVRSEYEEAAIYSGYQLDKYYDTVYKEDIRSELTQMLTVYDSLRSGDFDVGDLFSESGLSYMLWSGHFDMDVADKCVKKLMKCLNNEKWLEENAGYYVSENGKETFYDLTITARTFAAALDILKPAFISQSDYYDIKETLGDSDGGESIQVSFSTSGKYLTSLAVSAYSEYTSEQYIINFSKIGKTDIDVEQLEYWLSIAE